MYWKSTFKKLVVLILVCLTGSFLLAQNKMPVAYSVNVPQNYVRTWDALAPISNVDTLKARPLKDVIQETQYFDGLGRIVQSVERQGSWATGGTAADWVRPLLYDSIGSQRYKYLSFAANNTGGNTSINDGNFKLNPFQQDSTFSKESYSNENWYYSQINSENSPLNRELEMFAPGNSWVGTSGQAESNHRSVSKIYSVNTVTDSVRIWNVTDISNSFATYSTSGIYPAGRLFKIALTDENGHQVIEFNDKDGRTLLKKVQLTSSIDNGAGKGHYGWLCTYYLYDVFDRLRAVIQPKGVEQLLLSAWALNNTLLSEQCFRYEFDYRGRLIMKQIPGSGVMYLVYDGRGRIVMTQDSSMRSSHKWLYTLYDALNRPRTTGLITDNVNYNNPSYHWNHADTSTAWPNPASYVDEPLSTLFYDDYSWRLSEGAPLTSSYITTYDSYFQAASNNIWPYPQSNSITAQLKGFLTGTKTKVLGTSTYLFSVSFYDQKAMLVQVQSKNISGDSDVVTTQYSWAGKPLIVAQKQGKALPNAQTIVQVTQDSYDELWRLVKIEKKLSNTLVNSGTMTSYNTIVQNEYDKLGQLKEKGLRLRTIVTLGWIALLMITIFGAGCWE